MRNWVLVLACAAAACAQTEPGAELPPVRVEPSAGTGFQAATGETAFPVRAIARDATGAAQSIAGAACEARSSIWRTEFAAPARLVVPSFGRQSPQIRIDCASGGAEGAALVDPFYRRTNGFGGWPAVGVTATSGGDFGVGLGGWWNGGWGWDNPRTVIVNYPSVEVELR